MKKNLLFRFSLAILRAARALAVAALLVIVIASGFKLFGYKSIYVDELRGKLKFSIPKIIAISTPTTSVKATLQLEDIVMLSQITKMISKEPKRISPFFDTEVSILNPNLLQISLSIINLMLKVLSFLFVFHFMIKIMKNVLKDEVFCLENNYYLKIIAIIIMLSPLASYVLDAINTNTLVNFLGSNGHVTNNLGVYISNAPNFESLFFLAAGGFIYLLAKVQEYGLKLKQENDLTV